MPWVSAEASGRGSLRVLAGEPVFLRTVRRMVMDLHKTRCDQVGKHPPSAGEFES